MHINIRYIRIAAIGLSLIVGCLTWQRSIAQENKPTTMHNHEHKSEASNKHEQGKECESGHDHGKQGFHHSFDDLERWIQKFDDPKRDVWQKPNEVIKALNIGANDKVVDIGAGTGYFSLRIAKAYPTAKVYAADVEPNMVTHLEKQAKSLSVPNHIAIKVDPNEVRLPEKVNLVLVVDTYHHIDDRPSYFRHIRKQLADNARIAIIDFTPESPEGPPPEHRISKTELTKEMEQAGYKFNQEVTLLPNQYFLIFSPKE